jgi:hypothetical protein
MGFKCRTCGEEHEGLPMDIGYARPGDFLTVPPAERERRCRFTDDIGIIDGRRYYIRGVLPVPVHETGEHFFWGFWVRVSREDCERYRALWSVDGSNEPPFVAHLNVEDKPGYEGLNGHEVEVRLRAASERPTFQLRAEDDHRLAREQREGITLHQVEAMLHELFPDQF